MKEQIYSELQKLFGIKLPNYKYGQYYLELLKLSPAFFDLDEKIKMVQSLIDQYSDCKKYKLSRMDVLLKHFTDIGYTDFFNNIKVENLGLSKKEPNFISGKTYYSFDIKQANWTIFRNTILNNNPNFNTNGLLNDWESFMEKLNGVNDFGFTFDVHEALIKSKSWRQLFFGNINPKRLNSFQEIQNKKLLDFLINRDFKENIIAVNSEEIILDIDPSNVSFDNYFNLYKKKEFKVDIIENYGDVVKVYTENGIKTLKGVPLNRFFIHFKTLILNYHIQEEDLTFELDNKLAVWRI